MFGKNKGNHTSHPPVVGIPILCNFWKEDDVWNACTAHLPIVVFGDTFEEAKTHLLDAIISHFESVQEAGRIEELTSLLLERAKEYWTLNEIRSDSPIVKFLVSVTGQEVVRVCA